MGAEKKFVACSRKRPILTPPMTIWCTAIYQQSRPRTPANLWTLVISIAKKARSGQKVTEAEMV